jgi:hypothetical protein
VREKRMVLLLCAGCLAVLMSAPLYATEVSYQPQQTSYRIIGNWEIYQTKEPGKPYRKGYNGRPFVSGGPNAFTVLMHYRPDGTFRRVSRVGKNETVHDGKWLLSGHELRHVRNGGRDQEVIYVRFDNPNEYTLIEVFEDTQDPGLFARFKRVK